MSELSEIADSAILRIHAEQSRRRLFTGCKHALLHAGLIASIALFAWALWTQTTTAPQPHTENTAAEASHAPQPALAARDANEAPPQ